MPRDTAGGEDWKRRFSFGIRIDFTLLPCVAEQYRGETEETVVSRRGVRKIVVHSSQQREERTKKRRRGYRAFGFVAAVAVGVCGTRFARTVLALFPPSSLRLHRPIKAESGDLACILTPSPCGHFPYIPLQKYRGGRGGLILLLSLRVFLTPLLVATLLSSPLCFRKKI